ncbi:MAG: hypothetical protein AAGD25_29790 [Cyanobacteria bacterium P01_F01_bin.150]
MPATFQFKTNRIPSITRWTRFKHGDCPICQGQRKKKDCRQSPNSTVHCRSRLNPPPGWQFIGEDDLGFGMYKEGAEDARANPLHVKKTKKTKLEVLDNQSRDRQFRQIAKHSGLSQPHRTKIEKRGISPATIEKWYQDGLVWTWANGEQIPATSTLLPGIDPTTGNLRSDFWGYAIAIPSAERKLLGAQIKPNRGGGYFWVSSASIDGNDQRLANGETPIGLYGNHSPTLNFVEGYLKSAIAAERYGLTCVGASGGHWARSPKQLQDIIEVTKATTFILNPDGGMLDLKHRTVIEAYNRLRILLKKKGHQLLFRWWSQTSKTDGDIDEISATSFEQSQLLSWNEFIQHLEYDWNAEESFKNLLHDSKQRLDKATRQVAKGFGYQTPKPILKPKKHPQPQTKSPITATTTTSAIALWTPQKVAWLEVTSNTVPTLEEWISLGSPQLYCPRDQHNDVLVQLINKGYKTILLNGTGGDGKTHRAGEFAQDWETNRETIEGSKSATLHFVSPNYRNPDTATVENIVEKVSPAALDLDHSKRTPLGHPHRKRHISREKPADIPGLCSEDETIQRLQSKGLLIERGVKSNYCQNVCGLAFNCPYLQAKQAQGRPAVIREHISTITLTPSDEAPEQNGDVIIIDEAGRTIAPFNKTIDALTHDIDQEIGRFAQVHPKTYLQYKPVIDAIAQGIRRACSETGGDYGLVHAEVIQFLPTLARLEDLFFECEFSQWIKPTTDVWAKEQLTLQRLMMMLQSACNPNAWQDAVKTAKDNGLTLSGKALEGWISPQPLYRIYQAIASPGRTDITVSPSGLITFTYRDRRITHPLRQARTNILMDATPNLWELSRQLGVRRKDIVRLADYRPSYHNLTIKVICDLGNTCASRAALNHDGTLKRTGQYDIQIRIKKAVGAICALPNLDKHLQTTSKTGLLDYKKFMATYRDIPSLISGYCFNDNRGSNRFKECDRLISVSLATANLGAKLSQFHLMTGHAHTLKGASGSFWHWQRENQTNELIQDGFRLRAQHRPHQSLEWYILSNQLDNAQVNTLKSAFPGCTIDIVPILQLCPEAARKGVQIERCLVQTLYAQISAGQNASIDSIATQIGRTKGRLSQIAKTLNPKGFRAVKQSLVLLYQALESKTKLSEVSEDVRAIALEYLPAIADALTQNELSAQDALEQFNTIIECSTEDEMRQIVGEMPAEVIATLSTAFLPLAAEGSLEWLIQDFRAIKGSVRKPIPTS